MYISFVMFAKIFKHYFSLLFTNVNLWINNRFETSYSTERRFYKAKCKKYHQSIVLYQRQNFIKLILNKACMLQWGSEGNYYLKKKAFSAGFIKDFFIRIFNKIPDGAFDVSIICSLASARYVKIRIIKCFVCA